MGLRSFVGKVTRQVSEDASKIFTEEISKNISDEVKAQAVSSAPVIAAVGASLVIFFALFKGSNVKAASKLASNSVTIINFFGSDIPDFGKLVCQMADVIKEVK